MKLQTGTTNNRNRSNRKRHLPTNNYLVKSEGCLHYLGKRLSIDVTIKTTKRQCLNRIHGTVSAHLAYVADRGYILLLPSYPLRLSKQSPLRGAKLIMMADKFIPMLSNSVASLQNSSSKRLYKTDFPGGNPTMTPRFGLEVVLFKVKSLSTHSQTSR